MKYTEQKYTEQESRSEWQPLDKEYLDDLISEYELDFNEVISMAKESDRDNINSHIYSALHIARTQFLDKVRTYCEENSIDFGEKLEDYDTIMPIYLNYLDSGYDSGLSDVITPNPTEENILDALDILDIKSKDNEIDIDIQ